MLEESKKRNKGYLERLTDEIRYYQGQDVHGSLNPNQWDRHDKVRKSTHKTQYRSFIDLLPPYLDSTLSVVVNQSASNLQQSLLPKGVKSISLDAGRMVVPQTAKGRTSFEKNVDLSKKLSEQYQQLLEHEQVHFFSSLFGVMQDLSLYGNGILYLHLDNESAGTTSTQQYPSLKWLPFWKTYYSFDELDTLEWVYYEDKHYNSKDNRCIKYYLYTERGLWIRKKTIEENGKIIVDETYRYPKDIKAAFVAREGRYCGSQYGWGAGYQTLNYTKQLNWIADQIMYSTEKSVDNAYLCHANMRFSTGGQGTDVFDPSPRSMIAYSMLGNDMPDNQPPVIPLVPNGADIQYLSALSVTVRANLQSMFFVDPVLSTSMSGKVAMRSATEVLDTRAQSLVLYRSKAMLLENEILTPLTYSLLAFLGIKPGKSQEIRVQYFSIENQRAKQEKISDFAAKSELRARAQNEKENEEIEEMFED